MYGRWADVAPSLRFGTAHAAPYEAWPGYLEELEQMFGVLHAEARDLSLERTVEHAAARLLGLVLERTGAEDAWYATLAEALGWYLEDRVYDVDRMVDAIENVISGRFESWVAPAADQAQRTFVELAATVATIEASPPYDAIAEWTAIRRSAFANVGSKLGSEPVGDGHADFIARVDRSRDPVRADRMASALLLARDSAARGVGLGFDQLAEWQAVVLGRGAPVEFRTTRGFGKAGREIYEVVPARHFEHVLEEANDTKVPIAVRAARVYLDICFFHPFDDGNGRAARLALDYVLATAGLGLRAAGPLFTLARAANDRDGARSFAALLARLGGTMTR